MSLRSRITVVAALASAAVIAVAGFLIVHFTERDQRASLDTALAQQATQLARPATQLADSPIRHVIQRATSAGVDGDRTIRVLAGDGSTELDLGQPLATTTPPRLLPPGLSTLDLRGSPYAAYAVNVPSFALRHHGNPSPTPVTGGQVQVLAPLSPLQALSHRIRRRVITVGLGAVAATTIATWLLVSAALGSLQRLRRRVDSVTTTGDLTQRMLAEGPPEIVQVGTAFNALLDRVERSSADREQALASARGFAADAAHELRTPLTSLGTNLQLLRSSGADPALVAALADDHARLAATLEALHALTVGDLTSAGTDVVDLADLVALLAHEPHRHPGLTLTADIPDGPVEVRGDRESLRMLLDNLLTNAERHARPPGSGTTAVRLGVRRDGEDWVVAVDDDGRGWPGSAADREQLLERFTRGPDAGPGSGLGLAIAAQQARRHGGSLTLTDAPPPARSGARVELRLPAA